ncbi:hypothetical protein EW145_g3409 [Phellinidium pouzarii]|uniref:Cryptic loci regulator 2 N-terminal domain-containing protein n=1 Tax=Phellinidium pouzarii TaxID=167371 RepID=A0A4S4L955_9AGAM|nr:hypothetical protein EW145_g3409 [Phellinidium pouzarii]
MRIPINPIRGTDADTMLVPTPFVLPHHVTQVAPLLGTTMARSRLGKEATLPENPKWVTIDASDGDTRRWPTMTSPEPDAQGCINFMQPLSVDNGQSIKWRLIIGKALAEMHKYPDHDSKDWVLKAWPTSYQFYDHNKGNVGGPIRHDLYLVGSENVTRFRSPQEFTPHAFWLMTDPTQDRGNCYCKYCAKLPQRTISDAFGLSQRQAASPSMQAHLPARDIRAVRDKENRKHTRPFAGVFSSVRRVPKPVKLAKGPTQFVVPERERDLRAALGPKKLGEHRWAREGELVWVKLDHPVTLGAEDGTDEVVTFWPGLIEDVHFKTVITPKTIEDVTMAESADSATNGDVQRSHEDTIDPTPWMLIHKFLYKIKLLVVSKTVMYGDDHILPYQSHAPDNKLLSAVQSVYFDPDKPVDDNMEDMTLPRTSNATADAEARLFKQFELFDPFPIAPPILHTTDERKQYCEAAAGAFAVAIQIASRLTLYWTPSDEWQNKVHIPSTSVPSHSSGLSGTSRTSLSPSDFQSFRHKMLGMQSTEPSVMQTRFQGLWWGPERIWMGEMVRLKLARCQLAPDGTDIIKKPSGAGKSGRLEIKEIFLNDVSLMLREKKYSMDGDTEMHDAIKTDPSSTNEAEEPNAESLGAASRSVFMRVDGLFVAQFLRDGEDGTHNECRICGMLYELADDDWESDGEDIPSGPAMAQETKSEDTLGTDSPSKATVIATPLKNLAALKKYTTSLTHTDNSSVSQSTSDLPTSSLSAAPPPTSNFFAPNPTLLPEPHMDTDVFGPTQTNTGSNLLGAPSRTPLPPSSSFSSSVSANEKQRPDSLSPPPPAIPSTTVPTNPMLSGPLKPAEHLYPFPLAPPHSRFRPILPSSHEAIIPLTLLAGRYYPGILRNPLLRPRVQNALSAPHSQASDALWALEGLVGGALNAVDPSLFLPSRVRMVREAERRAWTELVGYWRQRVGGVNATIVVDDD